MSLVHPSHPQQGCLNVHVRLLWKSTGRMNIVTKDILSFVVVVMMVVKSTV